MNLERKQRPRLEQEEITWCENSQPALWRVSGSRDPAHVESFVRLGDVADHQVVVIPGLQVGTVFVEISDVVRPRFLLPAMKSHVVSLRHGTGGNLQDHRTSWTTWSEHYLMLDFV